ncbi:MAG: hypothetical protein M3P45_14965 [Acidobacteriota bacterium]|nr:hypothetical protein [Acidobacteriota bacterium]
MMVVFFTALLLVAGMAAAPSILQQGKREKEQEMIWRGRQYVRGVKLYYRKMGRFPTSIDDLTKPKTGSLRFMRQAYKDPMNGGDGTWRLIYVGPAGQLIGSLKPPQTLQLPGAGAGLGTPASALAANSAQKRAGGLGASSFGSFGNSAGGATGAPAGAGSSPPGTPPANGEANPQGGGQAGAAADGSQPAATDSSGAAGSDAMSTPQAITPTETPTIIGGNIIGVGSKISAPSVIVYDKAKNYHLFEFIWDPSKDATIAGQPPQTGTGLGQNIGTNPSSFGQQPGAATPPSGTPAPPPNAPNTPANPSSEIPPLDPAPAPAPEPEPPQ